MKALERLLETDAVFIVRDSDGYIVGATKREESEYGEGYADYHFERTGTGPTLEAAITDLEESA